jgi:methionyl-tRNA synthetase
MSIKEIYEHHSQRSDTMSRLLVDLINTQRTTPAKIRYEMENLKVDEALRSMIELLRVVRLISRLWPILRGEC